jgi:hypothetical protein
MAGDSRWGDAGIVFISENPDLEPRFRAHWETERDGKGVFLEDSPGFDRAEDAVAWGRSRSPFVLIRLGPIPQQYCSAGERQPPDLQLPEWRPDQ